MARWFVDRSPQQGIPSVSLRGLLPDARFIGCRDLVVSGCSADSRRLDPGQVFVAVRGRRHDGHEFIGRAIDRGAVGVVVERPCPEAGRFQVIVPDARRAFARLCQALAGAPAERLRPIGVAGEHGRTATALFLRSILEAHGGRCGLAGGLGWSDGVNDHPAGPSDPGAEALAEMMAAMLERRCDGCVLELSASDLRGGLVEGITLEAAVVTGLGSGGGDDAGALAGSRRDHARLLRLVAPGGATVVNADDVASELLGGINLGARRVSFGLGRPADVTARIDRLDAGGTRLRIFGFDREAKVALRLIGPGNVTSALAASAVAWSRGVSSEAVIAGLEAVARVPGRLEPVGEGTPFGVWLDRSRTAADLRDALTSLRTIVPGRLHCVLDATVAAGSRRGVAAVAEELADRVVVSIDGPADGRSDAAIDEVLSGFRRPGPVRAEPDRRRAIESALEIAAPGDGVLIVGSGRRPLQVCETLTVSCDDRSIAAPWLARAFSSRRRSA